MRILAVGNMYPPHHLGGYELMWQAADDHARSCGHEVRVLASDHRERSVQEPDAAGVFRTLRWYWSWERYEFPELSVPERVRLERANAAELRRHLADFRPDVVAWWAMGCMSLSLIEQVRRAGVPAVGVVGDAWMDYGPQVDAWTRIWRGWRRPIAPLAQRVTGIPAASDPLAGVGPVLFASDMLRRKARERGVELAVADFAHRGVERELFEPAARPDWGWRLACVGRIDPRKGIDLAIEALARLPAEATLAIVGGGDDDHLAELRALAANRDVAERVTFTTSERDRLQNVYAAADVIVFPVVWEEPWGLVPLEAMAVGAPVVASGRGGSAEYLRDRENCLIFDVEGGGEALAGAIRELAGDPELRERVRSAGFRTSGRLTVDAYDAAIERLLLGVAKPG